MTGISLPSKRNSLIHRAVDSLLRRVMRVLPAGPVSEQVALWWGYRFRPGPSVARLRSGLRIHVESVDHLQLLIYYLGVFEPRSVSVLRQIVKLGATVVDVGANIGLFTLESALAAGANGRVIAIEASRSHVGALRENLRLNTIGNVTTVEVAVADAPGEAILVRPDGGNLGMFTLGAVRGDDAHQVAVRRLDQILEEQGAGRVNVIKMDIEGSEYRALCGAARVLAEDRPAILIELNEIALRWCGSSCSAVKNLLHDAGYRGWVIGRTKFQPIIEGEGDHDCDECLFIHREDDSMMNELGLTS
jgi:FkbM family methyltransferase